MSPDGGGARAMVTGKRIARAEWLYSLLGLRGLSPTRRREALQGYLLVSLWVIGFLVFTAGPMLASFYYSFCNYHVQRPAQFIGWGNYSYALFEDDLFWLSVRRTLTWTVFTVPLGILGSLLAAILLNQRLVGSALYRTLFFLPHLTPTIAAALLWIWMLQPDIGIMNSMLDRVGIRGPNWLGSVDWALPSLAMIALWTGIGGNRMIIFLAGLQGIPQEMYEAAEIDGANVLQKTIHITLPLISPAMFFNLLLGIIGSFHVFGMAFVATSGGPAHATYFYALHIYYQAFVSFAMGYGSALAWIFFAVTLFLTIIQVRLQERWVFYEGAVR